MKQPEFLKTSFKVELFYQVSLLSAALPTLFAASRVISTIRFLMDFLSSAGLHQRHRLPELTADTDASHLKSRSKHFKYEYKTCTEIPSTFQMVTAA